MTDPIICYKPSGERDYVQEHFERIQAEHRARLQKKSSPEEIELWNWIFSLPIRALAFVLFLPVRYGYGKQYLWALLFLFLVAPVLLFAWALAMGIHAQPQVFLAHWQAYVLRHPGAVHWTWAVRDVTGWIRAW
ncbi:hypothetical protein [Acidithiobacillus sulfuriphilus]|uniref:hypothetical protein n=1 Tax=Acidithiobacillus sulfuriphilus TaxID=1867749 RepID=UPI003F5DE813